MDAVTWYRLCLISYIALLPIFAHATSTTSVPVMWEQKETTATPEFKISHSLSLGMEGNEVKTLQEFLSRIPDTFPASPTGYFGEVTQRAIKRFQEREHVAYPGTSGYGQVGPKTTEKINEVIRRGTPATQTEASHTTPPPPSLSANASTSTSISTTHTASQAAGAPTDTTPPVRLNGFPFDVLPMGTTTVLVSLMTDEPAQCYWSNFRDVPYDLMSTPLVKALGGTKHTYMLFSVSPGNYAFYVRCRDSNLNTNTSDYPILFSVEYGEPNGDKTPPRVMISFPTNGDSLLEGMINISAAASDNLGVKGVHFFLNAQDLNYEDGSPPFGVTVMLLPGAYHAFAVAHDLAGNRATSTEISFTVKAGPVAAASRPSNGPSSANLASAFYALSGMLELLFSLRLF